MNKVKAWNASNSRAITKFHNADIVYFELKMLIHELIIGTLGHLTTQHFDQRQGHARGRAPEQFTVV